MGTSNCIIISLAVHLLATTINITTINMTSDKIKVPYYEKCCTCTAGQLHAQTGMLLTAHNTITACTHFHAPPGLRMQPHNVYTTPANGALHMYLTSYCQLCTYALPLGV